MPNNGQVRTWRRSTRCITEHHCVEVARVRDGVALRNSQRPADMLVLDQGAWGNFVAGVKAGEFGGDQH